MTPESEARGTGGGRAAARSRPCSRPVSRSTGMWTKSRSTRAATSLISRRAATGRAAPRNGGACSRRSRDGGRAARGRDMFGACRSARRCALRPRVVPGRREAAVRTPTRPRRPTGSTRSSAATVPAMSRTSAASRGVDREASPASPGTQATTVAYGVGSETWNLTSAGITPVLAQSPVRAVGRLGGIGVPERPRRQLGDRAGRCRGREDCVVLVLGVGVLGRARPSRSRRRPSAADLPPDPLAALAGLAVGHGPR